MELTTTVSALLTLAVFSFLYRDNPYYKFAERLLVGLAIGWSLVEYWDQALYSLAIRPIISGESCWPILPLAAGLLLFARFSRGKGWLTAIPLSVMIGAGVGATAPALFRSYTLNFTIGLIDNAHAAEGALLVVSSIVMLAAFFTGLAYFYFGRRASGGMNTGAKIGVYFLMVFFGATIGYTVMSRMTILIGRLDFLLRDWLGVI